MQASMWYSDVSNLLSEGCQLFEKLIWQKRQSCILRGAWAVAACNSTSQGDLGHTPALNFNRIVVQSTLLHFSSESGPSGKFRHFQILRVHDALLQVIGKNCLGKSWHQNSTFWDDIQASMWYSDVSNLLSECCQLFEKCISQKCQSCSLRGVWAVAPCSLTSQGDLGHTPT